MFNDIEGLFKVLDREIPTVICPTCGYSHMKVLVDLNKGHCDQCYYCLASLDKDVE